MEIKLVIDFKDNRAIIGAKSPDTDPYFELFEGDLPKIISNAPGVAERAQAKWAVSKLNPAIKIPAAAPAPAVSTSKPAAATTSGSKPAPAVSSSKPAATSTSKATAEAIKNKIHPSFF